MKTSLNNPRILKLKKYQVANLNKVNLIKGGEEDNFTDTTIAKTIPTGTK